MAIFVLQNRDASELYWCEEYGWVDAEHADQFVGTELDEDYCLELVTNHGGRWVRLEDAI